MNDQEREQLAENFDYIHQQLDALYARLSDLLERYPGLDSEQMFSRLMTETAEASTTAEGLADYVRVATDENWKVR